MNFDPNEVLYLLKADWDAIEAKGKPLPQMKGLAIDAAIKRIFGCAGRRFDPYDLRFDIDNISHHEIKSSSTMNSFTVSAGELENATLYLDTGSDTLYWLFEQLPARDEYRFVGLVRFSDLYMSQSIRSSKYDAGYYFAPSAARPYFLT